MSFTPSRCCAHSSGASARSRPGWVKSAKISRRYARSRRGRGALRSICGRARSISWSYFTPDGQAVTHAMQPRQRSRCTRISSDASRALLVADAHQHDAPARRVHLLVEDRVARAGRQAEAAVHAVGDQVGVGRPVRVPGGRAHQIPPTKVPGRKMRAGSKRSLTRAITASAPGSGAAQRPRRSSGGASSSVHARGASASRAAAIAPGRPAARASTARARGGPTTRRAGAADGRPGRSRGRRP